MISKKLIVLFLSTISLMSHAQSYKGTVLDQNQAPVAFANVRAYNLDSTFVTGAITDEQGKFEINPSSDNIYLQISFLGYEPKYINPTQQDLGKITLQEKMIEGVEIAGKRDIIEQKVDRLVFNVEDAVSSKGGTAINVLKDTPGLNVEQDNLSIVGKGNVRVMINGRLSQLSGKELITFLQSIPSDDIKKVEVITSPPAKYDAEGNSGLINIVLKKAKKDSWSDQVRASYLQATYPTVTLGNTFNFNKKKWTVSLSGSATKGHKANNSDIDVYYPDAPWDMQVNVKSQQDKANARLNVDYDLSSKSSIGASYSFSIDDGDHDDNGINSIRDPQKSYQVNRGFTDEDAQRHALNLHYNHKIDTLGKVISTDLDYFDSKSSADNRFSSQRFVTFPFYFEADNNSSTDIQNYSAKIDMIHPTKWGNLSYGIKATSTITNSDVALFNRSSGNPVFDPSKSNEFRYQEDIQAVYLDGSKKLGKKWQIKAGLRLENSRTEGYSKTINQTNTNEYLNLFPTFYLAYTPNRSHFLNFNYSRRIQRPGFYSLNPFRFYLNANSFAEGNPFLKPQISDNLELSHTYKGFLITKLFGQITNQGANQLVKVNKTDKTIIATRDNFYKMKMIGLQETFIYQVNDRWSMVADASLFHSSFDYQKTGIEAQLYDGFGSSLYYKNTFVLNKKKTIQLEATVIASGPIKYAAFDLEPKIFANLGVNFSMLQNKMNLAINANDIFRSSPQYVHSFSSGVKQRFWGYSDSQNLRVSLSYNFGNRKIQARKRKTGNDDIKNRSNK